MAGAVLAAAWADLALAQDLIEYIEVHRVLGPGEMIDFVHVDEFDVVTRRSIVDPGSLGFVTAQVPSNARGKSVRTPSCCYAKLDKSIVSGPTPGFNQSADIPLLVNNANGLTVVLTFLLDSLSLVPALQVDDTVTVSAGASSEFSFATLLELPSTAQTSPTPTSSTSTPIRPSRVRHESSKFSVSVST